MEAGDLTEEGRKMADTSEGEELEELRKLINRRMEIKEPESHDLKTSKFFFQMITFVHGKSIQQDHKVKEHTDKLVQSQTLK